MSYLNKLAGASLLVLVLAGCDNTTTMGDGNTSDNTDDTSDMVTSVEFATFVKTQIESTPANADASAVNDLQFEFNNRNNSEAFNELFD